MFDEIFTDMPEPVDLHSQIDEMVKNSSLDETSSGFSQAWGEFLKIATSQNWTSASRQISLMDKTASLDPYTSGGIQAAHLVDESSQYEEMSGWYNFIKRANQRDDVVAFAEQEQEGFLPDAGYAAATQAAIETDGDLLKMAWYGPMFIDGSIDKIANLQMSIGDILGGAGGLAQPGKGVQQVLPEGPSYSSAPKGSTTLGPDDRNISSGVRLSGERDERNRGSSNPKKKKLPNAGTTRSESRNPPKETPKSNPPKKAPSSNSGDSRKGMSTGAKVGLGLGAVGLGYGAKKLYDRHKANKKKALAKTGSLWSFDQ